MRIGGSVEGTPGAGVAGPTIHVGGLNEEYMNVGIWEIVKGNIGVWIA